MYTALSTNEAGESPVSSRTDRAYADLKRRLLVDDFPLVERLGEERLATLLGVSRTPIREALARLHHEGLVERHLEGGYRPSIPDLVEVHELYEMRISLERESILRPTKLDIVHNRATIKRIFDEWSSLALDPPTPSPEFVLVDEEFHLSLAAAAGNRVMVETLAGVNERIRVVRMHDFLTAERVEATISQHVSIVASLLKGEFEPACALLLAHLGESMAVVEERAALALARMISGERVERVERVERKIRP